MSRCLAPRRVRRRRQYAQAMARSWAELLGDEGAVPEPVDQGGGRLFLRLRDSLSKSRRALTGELAAATSFDPGDDADWERLEEALIAGDVGVRATAELGRRLEAPGGAPGPQPGRPRGGGGAFCGGPAPARPPPTG